MVIATQPRSGRPHELALSSGCWCTQCAVVTSFLQRQSLLIFMWPSDQLKNGAWRVRSGVAVKCATMHRGFGPQPLESCIKLNPIQSIGCSDLMHTATGLWRVKMRTLEWWLNFSICESDGEFGSSNESSTCQFHCPAQCLDLNPMKHLW